MSERLFAAAPVTRVTAFEDRAQVVRAVEVTVPAGRCEVVLEGVTPLLSDAHLSARCEGATVEEVRADRRWAAPAESDQLPALRTELQAAERARAGAKRTWERARERAAAAEAMVARYLEHVGPAVWAGDDGHQGWREALATLEGAADVAHAGVDEARAAQRAADEVCDRLERLLHDADRHEVRFLCDVTVRLFAEAAGPVTLALTAVVPCALWRPAHEARLMADGQVRWTTYGTVWQRTGEAWRGIELALSTDRPGAGADLPELGEDRLRLREKAVKKRVVLEHREEAVSQDRGDAAVPGVYDGGEARVFVVEGVVDVPDDGRPHRVATGGFESACDRGLQACPEVAAHVFLRAKLRNLGAQPLLAGPVTLVRDGAYVGVGEIAYVGPGEPFELSFGSDDRFGVTCERSREVEKRTLAKDRTHFVTRARIASSAATRERVNVVLRLPVSELEALDVRTSEDWCTDGKPAPDAEGLVRLEADLAPGEAQRVTLGFHLERSGDVVLPDPW